MNFKDYDLYILDYDGCLLDSMPGWRSSASNFIKSLGLTPKEGLDESIPIFTDLYSGEVLKRDYNLPYSMDTLMKMIDSYVDYFYPLCPLKDGALSILKKLKDLNKKVVVISASSLHLLDISMESHKIKEYFTGLYSVYNHETLSKTDGSAMEYVRRIYDVKKEKILMLDDSLSNVLGAKAYGIDCISIYDDYSSKNKEEELRKSSLAFMKLSEFEKLL